MKRAFTLIEALVTIAIIAILAGILLPVLASSKKSAFRTDDLSKMHQLGLAGAMYEDRYGELPISTTQVVAAGFITSDLCASIRDTSIDGVANDVAHYTQRGPLGGNAMVAGYKNTFLGLGEFGLNSTVLHDYVLSGPNPGWLVDVTESKRTPWPTPTQWEGTYRRLCADGSVIVRQHQDIQCYDNGKERPCRIAPLLYVDPSPYLTELIKSDDQQYSHHQG